MESIVSKNLITDLEMHNFHAYLFIGKKETAMEILEEIKKEKHIEKCDEIELSPEDDNPKSVIKTEATQKFVSDLNRSAFGENKIGIIYEAQKLNPSSGNLLLKTIEEPSPNTYIFLWSKSEDILSTISSRCRIYKENNIPDPGEQMIGIYSLEFEKASGEIDLLVKNGQAIDFIAQTTRHLEKKMLSSKEEKFADLIGFCAEVEKRIRANANSRLQLENLYLKIREYI